MNEYWCDLLASRDAAARFGGIFRSLDSFTFSGRVLVQYKYNNIVVVHLLLLAAEDKYTI
jgi:hypothetical protein